MHYLDVASTAGVKCTAGKPYWMAWRVDNGSGPFGRPRVRRMDTGLRGSSQQSETSAVV